jgi:hypothetical protein
MAGYAGNPDIQTTKPLLITRVSGTFHVFMYKFSILVQFICNKSIISDLGHSVSIKLGFKGSRGYKAGQSDT